MLGKPLMEWQQHVADVVLEIDPDTGDLAYDEWRLTVPRQSGKSTLVLAKASHRCMATQFFGAMQQIAYTAQTKLKAVEKFERDYATILEHSPRVRARVRTGNQKVDIRYPNGSIFGVEAVTEKAGHGATLDEGVIDEAFSQQDNRTEQALGPAMITRRNKQLGVLSTAGWLDASPYLLEKVQSGRALVERGVTRGVAFFEWSAPEDADPADESVWLACMPALHRPDCDVRRCKRHTITLAAIRSEHAKAVESGKLADFCRAYLNQWKLKPREGEETALGNWAACGRDLAEFPDAEALGLAVAHDRSAAALGAAGWLEPDLPLLSLVDYRPGVEWLASEAARLSVGRGLVVVVDVGGPAGKDTADAVEAAGGRVLRVRTGDVYVEACADVFDRVQTGRLAHPRDPVLDESVQGARWRPLGDRRVFGRKVSVGDLSPLESVTLALRGLSESTEVWGFWE